MRTTILFCIALLLASIVHAEGLNETFNPEIPQFDIRPSSSSPQPEQIVVQNITDGGTKESQSLYIGAIFIIILALIIFGIAMYNLYRQKHGKERRD